MLLIRHETPADWHAVEALTRRAFWNVHTPGCRDHYLVHCLRQHADFIPELDFVLELDGQLIGSILFSRSQMVDARQRAIPTITFGPVSIDPAFQHRGYGGQLIRHAIEQARLAGYSAIIIFGDPSFYCRFGFKCCKRFGLRTGDGKFSSALLVLELNGTLPAGDWTFVESPVFDLDSEQVAAFERQFPPMVAAETPSQELFYILSQASLE